MHSRDYPEANERIKVAKNVAKTYRASSRGWMNKLCIALFALCVYSTAKMVYYMNEHLDADRNTDFIFRSLSKASRKLKFFNIASLWDSRGRHYENNEACAYQKIGLPDILKNINCKDCSDATCYNFLFGNGSEYYYKKIDKHKQDLIDYVELEKPLYLSITNCSKFRKTYGYRDTLSKTSVEKQPIAYSIFLRDNPLQAERLLRSIYSPSNEYCFHINSADTNSKVYLSILKLTNCFSNVFIASKLENIIEGGFSRLQADINCINDLMERNKEWKYLINIDSYAFPLKTNREILQVLKIYNGTNDIMGRYGPSMSRDHFEDEWLPFENIPAKNETIMKKTGRKNLAPPYDIDVVSGSGFGIFYRQFIVWALADKRAQAFFQWLKTSYHPENMFWASLHHTFSNPHLDPPGGYSGIPNGKPSMVTYSTSKNNKQCNDNLKSLCSENLKNLPSIRKRQELFVYPLQITQEPLVVECLEAWIQHKTKCPPRIDAKFYSSLSFVSENIHVSSEVMPVA